MKGSKLTKTITVLHKESENREPRNYRLIANIKKVVIVLWITLVYIGYFSSFSNTRIGKYLVSILKKIVEMVRI